jgi:hypothetical protein
MNGSSFVATFDGSQCCRPTLAVLVFLMGSNDPLTASPLMVPVMMPFWEGPPPEKSMLYCIASPCAVALKETICLPFARVAVTFADLLHRRVVQLRLRNGRPPARRNPDRCRPRGRSWSSGSAPRHEGRWDQFEPVHFDDHQLDSIPHFVYISRLTGGMMATFVDQLASRLASEIGNRLVSAVERRSVRRMGGAAAGPTTRRRKLDMSCRVADCTNRSGGPRFGFICDEHRKIPRRDRVEAWYA